MKKISIIFLVSISLLITSCFKKEEVKVTESPKTEIQKNDISVDTNSGVIENKTTSSTGEIISNSGTTQKPKQEIKKDVKKIEENAKNNEIQLIDAYLSDETEELSEEEKISMKQNIPEIDTNTLVRFKDSYYFKDYSNIYYFTPDDSIYSTKYRITLKGLKIDNFYIINEEGFRYYGTDGKNIYYEGKIISDKINFNLKIIDANYIYGDNNNLYLFGKTFKGGDLNSIKKIGDHCYKDIVNLYCLNAYGMPGYYTIIKGIDVQSVEVVGDGYLKDKYGFYYFYIDGIAKKIDGIKDIESFTFTGGTYQDNKCTYLIEGTEATCTPKEIKSSTNLGETKLIDVSFSDETEELSEEEKKSFIERIRRDDVIVDKESLVKIKYSGFYKDKKDLYGCTFIGCYSMGKNPENIKVVKQDGSIWTDGKDLYGFSPKVNNFDLDSLKYTKLNGLDILGDKYNLYFGGKSYKGGDINSLVSISKNCLKDNNNVYCGGEMILDAPAGYNYKIVESVDKDTFQEINIDFYKDKNNIYKYQYKEDKYEIINGIKDINSFTVINDIPQDEFCTYKIEGNEANCNSK